MIIQQEKDIRDKNNIITDLKLQLSIKDSINVISNSINNKLEKKINYYEIQNKKLSNKNNLITKIIIAESSVIITGIIIIIVQYKYR